MRERGRIRERQDEGDRMRGRGRIKERENYREIQ